MTNFSARLAAETAIRERIAEAHAAADAIPSSPGRKLAARREFEKRGVPIPLIYLDLNEPEPEPVAAPSPKKVGMTIRLDAEMHEWIVALAADQERSVASQITYMLRTFREVAP
jgi:hypothetical protein